MAEDQGTNHWMERGVNALTVYIYTVYLISVYPCVDISKITFN